MTADITKKPRRVNAEAQGKADESIAVGEFSGCSHAQQYSAECGKAAALALFNFEVLSLHAVQRMFDRKPVWRSA